MKSTQINLIARAWLVLSVVAAATAGCSQNQTPTPAIMPQQNIVARTYTSGSGNGPQPSADNRPSSGPEIQADPRAGGSDGGQAGIPPGSPGATPVGPVPGAPGWPPKSHS